MQRFSEKLRILRKRHGLTQRQLGEQADISKSFIKDLECGYRNPNASHLLKISRFFGVSLDVLMKDELDLDEDKP